MVGVDLSEEMLALARRKAAALDAPALWYHADVLNLPGELNGSGDLVFTGKGSLPWVQDLGAWARGRVGAWRVGAWARGRAGWRRSSFPAAICSSSRRTR